MADETPAQGTDPFVALFNSMGQQQQAAPANAPTPDPNVALFNQAGSEGPPVEQPGIVSRALSDIGTGITELPRAIVKGARDAVQETVEFGVDAKNYALGGDTKAPQLPDLDKPTSTTGQFATSVSQFVTGMIGLGKIVKPVKLVGRGARIAQESARAATVGAVAFDPHDKRLSDLINDSLPVLSNPVTRFLSADPTDSKALGRVKNALESIGLDGVLIGSVVAGTKLFKALRDFQSGKATEKDVAAAMVEAERAEAKAATATGETPNDVRGNDTGSANAAGTDPSQAGAEPPTGSSPSGGAAVADGAAPREGDIPGGVAGETAKRVDSTTQGAGPEGVTPKPKPVDVTPEQAQSLLKSMREDTDAVAAAGSWEAAVNDGYRFGKGERIPWQKMAIGRHGEEGNTHGLEAFVMRLADELQAPLNAMRGGDKKAGVMHDAMVERMVAQRARLWGEDPAALMGVLQLAGKNARTMAANMEAGFLVGQRAVQDAYALASRIKAGDLSGGGEEQLRQLLGVAATLFGQAQAMRASAGRSMRRMRSEFAPSQADIEAISALDPQKLVDAIVATGGDARSMKIVLQPSFAKRLMDVAQFNMVNGLLWSPRTHVVNLATNLYMVIARPMERVIGSMWVGGKDGQRIRAESWKQYVAMGSTLGEAWNAARMAWQRGDSVIAPHKTEHFTQGLNAADFGMKPWNSVSNVLYNALVVPSVKVIGTPTRALGAVDEAVKNVVYRSRVIAQAQVDGIQRGLSGDDLTAFTRDKLYKAFDKEGRGIDLAALQEAKTATFQQDLLPHTAGHAMQNMMASQQWMRFVVPFLRTPVNVLRYGWKMTPVLNGLQTEYRQMIRGAQGPGAQAQAVGQLALGSIFMATASWAAGAGLITGGGPSDRQVRSALLATGWMPYSYVTPGKNGEKVYTQYGRFDPIMMPIGIVADIVDAYHQMDDNDGALEQIGTAAHALGLSLAKQITSKAYLLSLSQALDAVMDPDRSMGRYSRQMVTNFVPLSSGLRFVNDDPHLRETRSYTDAILATLPGYSKSLPPRRDAFGDPITVNKGLWVTGDKDAVDREVVRMAEEAGKFIGPPSPTHDGVDLRDITLKDGRNAFDAYQTWAAKPAPNSASLKEQVAKIMGTAAYRNAPDGDADVRGTRLYMLSDILRLYREAAMRRVKADPNVREAMGKREADVRAAYTAARSPKTPQQEGRGMLQRLGDAFGVNLGGL